MQPAIQQALSQDEYLALDAVSNERHEFYQGEIFAMAGGTFNHATIAGNIFSILKRHLRGKTCHPMNSDMRIHTPAGLDTYPDISIYCGTPQLQDKQCTLLNPVAIFEVLSPSTRDYDRGDKFSWYRSIPSLNHYVLVDSEAIAVEHFQRIAIGEWVLREYRLLTDTISLMAMEINLPLSEIYELIEW